MTNQNEKPRTWIIKKDKFKVSENWHECIQIAEGECVGNNKVKVVEHSAYEQLKQENERLREALSFYADISNWSHTRHNGERYGKYNMLEHDDDLGDGEFYAGSTDDLNVSGKRARQALSETKGDE